MRHTHLHSRLFFVSSISGWGKCGMQKNITILHSTSSPSSTFNRGAPDRNIVVVGVVLCLTFVIIIIVVSNSNFRISTTISRIGATLVPLHSSSQYQSISIATSAKHRYFVIGSCCGTPQEHLSSTLRVISQSILYVRRRKLQFRNPLLLLY